MDYLRAFKRLSRARQVGAVLTAGMLLWSVGVPAFFTTASAANLTLLSDTITNPSPSEGSNHSVVWYASSTLSGGQTIKIQFDPATDAFNLSAFATATDLTLGSNMTFVADCTGAAQEVQALTLDTTAPDESLTLRVCAGDTISTGTTTVNFNNNKIINPAGEGSYVIRVAGTQPDTGDTRVAIINAVTMSASVDTSLTFTIAGVDAFPADTVNGDTITSTTTATTIPFGTLAVGVAKVGAQDLTVTTNARNGYQVTIKQDQNLTSSTGADLDVFIDGNGRVAPTAWVSPAGTLGQENTYGHYGVTSEDATLAAGDEFGASLYAGNFATTTRLVMYHTGPADGTTADIGATRVGFQIEITALQEAANDYTNRIFYVCTPVF
ncbi:MAG TPA: hypothetical protein VLB83_03660 [Candidatus Paceibacterota bacterium]|nr:hypothetical protein [Candidatus Paceibacterota bacterium]